ncbi:response regulator [Vibrio fortis]|uniref:Response regulator n=1 Tax=Vibrio fortis TaxID=212667 RepID=A0A5N3R886_9VIBR|nr:response regulator [Vibrio fortis]KAB0290666.1 response regulator [Vibrio fortis]
MNIVICDDSSLARKSLQRCISPAAFGIVTFMCSNGREAIATVIENSIDLMFLDLTMPEMDGYEVLQYLQDYGISTDVVVISGDVQQEAKRRCMELGASSFIAKPFNQDEVTHLIQSYVFKNPTTVQSQHLIQEEPDIDPLSKFREVTNIALGRGAAVISDRIGKFIDLPVPNVGIVEASELNMIIADALHRDSVHAVTQRFVGNGIHGESLVCMRGQDIGGLGHALGFPTSESNHNEMILNIANLLVSTYLNSLASQLVVDFSLRQPVTVSKNEQDEFLSIHHVEQSAFTVEFTYLAEHLDFECEVLLLLDGESVETLYRLMEVL